MISSSNGMFIRKRNQQGCQVKCGHGCEDKCGKKARGVEGSAQVWKEIRLRAKKFVFYNGNGCGGRKVGVNGRACAGPGSRCSRFSPQWQGCSEVSDRLPEKLAGYFTGHGKERNVRHIIGVCKWRFLDALAGAFRGR